MKFTIVVSGKGVAVRCRKTKLIRTVIADVLQESGHVTFVDWEMRLPDGRLLDQFDPVGDMVENGAVLFLNPRAGIAGATLDRATIEANMDRARLELPELNEKLNIAFRLSDRRLVLQ